MSAVRQRITVTRDGFSLHSKNRSIVGWREHAEQALAALREIHQAETIKRVSDGALIAEKHWLTGESVFAWLSWLATRAEAS